MTRQRLVGVLVAGGLVSLLGWAVTDTVLGQARIAIMPAQPVVIQPGGPGLPPGNPGTGGGSAAAQLSGIKIIEKSEFRQVINVARDCVKDKAWEEAVTALQALLDNKEDHYVQVRDRDALGKETMRWTSVKFEANNLLGSMPEDGLQIYELRMGGKAKTILDDAKRKGDRELLAEVAQRYCHTKAGIEANELLATLFLARGQHFIAALRFEKLLAMDPARTKLSDLTLYKAALAYHRSGDDKAADAVWQKLEAAIERQGGLRVGEDMVPMAKLKQVLHEDNGGLQVSSYEWAMVRGNTTNTAQANGSPPLLDSILWRRPMLGDKHEYKPQGSNEIKVIVEEEDQARARVEQAINDARKHNIPVMSGFFPVATKGMLIYRTHSGLRAVAIRELTDKNRKYKPGEIVWKTFPFDVGLANMLDKAPAMRPIVDQWLGGGGVMQPQPNPFPQPFPPGGQPGGMFYFSPTLPGVSAVLYENSLIGTLSTDHQYVYAIDDLAVPPPYGYNPFIFQQGNMGEVREYVTRNVLRAFSIEQHGKLVWDLGGKDDPLFADSHFLGAPISIGGKLYVLNEKNLPTNNTGGEAELRLVCIDPTKRTPQGKAVVVEPIQMLGMVQPQSRVAFEVARRTHAAHLAFGEGILVCPTNAGEVFGVDLMNRALVWSYPYREQAFVGPFQNNNMAMPGFPGPFPKPGPFAGQGSNPSLGNWKSAPPAIADGKVVFTAPDSNSIHCINLRDGTPVWKAGQREGDLYMAGVFGGKVLVVGKSSIRALNLQNGGTVWSMTTGDLPSGQGIASKNIYYLPLSKGEILAVDIERGTLKAHNRAAGDAAKIAPGNLVFYEGAVLSVTPTDVVAYPQLAARLDEATVALKADPDNLEKLTNHGELLLKDGQVHAAVADLEKVVAKNAGGALGQRAKDRLYEALTDLLLVSFNETSDKYLDLYKVLSTATTDDQEKQLRQAKYFRIVGQGREAQGNLVEAFKMYRDFGALPIHNANGGIVSLDDPTHKVPTNVWLRGRVSAMIARATPEQRAPLEAKIADEWKEVRGKKDLDAIRSFVGMFDVPFEVGREARLHLADTIMDSNDRPAFLEAEMNLAQLLAPSLRTNPAVAGRALATLATLEEKKGTAGSIEVAAGYYRRLAREFGKVPVRDGKTGEDLFNELPPKIYLPYLEESRSSWGPSKMAARKLGPGGYSGGLQFMLVPEGDLTPFARQHRLTFDPNNPINTQIRLVDIATGKERWSQNLGQVAGNNQVFFALYQQNNINVPYGPNARHRMYHVKGHLIVAQIGVNAFCIDGDNGKVLWRHPLFEGLENQPNLIVQPAGADADGNPEFMLFNPQFGGRQSRLVLGHIGAVQASYVALMTPKGLVVNDPLRGTALWKMPDLSPTTRVFGDEEYLYLVEGGDGGGTGAGRVLRAIDGQVVKADDFGPIYQHRINVNGRRILAAVPGKGLINLRLYDIVTGKDVWSKKFDANVTVLRTEDLGLTGVIDPKGQLTVLDAHNGEEILTAGVMHGKIGADDLKGLHHPLLLADSERFYIALNKPIEANKLGGGQAMHNFSNGLRCQTVNGWVVALHRKDGAAKVKGEMKPFKKGSFAWHSFTPLTHQMVVTEQFDQLPVLLFSVRYNEPINGGANGFRWQSYTQSINKKDGKFIYDEGPEGNNSSPQYFGFTIDPRAGTINLVGYTSVIQHYVDDGRKIAPPGGSATGAMLDVPPPAGVAMPAPAGFGNGGRIIGPAIRINRNLQVVPQQLVVPVAPEAPVPVAPVPER